MQSIYYLLFLPILLASCFNQSVQSISNKDGSIEVKIWNDEKNIFYKIQHQNAIVLDTSVLGVETEEGDFENLKFTGRIDEGSRTEWYSMLQGKQKNITYSAKKFVFVYDNDKGNRLNVEFELSQNGVALRYIMESASAKKILVHGEKTSYHLLPKAKAWLQPMSKAKTGWKETNPSYEEPYKIEVDVNAISPTGEGWVYPALFKSDSTWLLISETNLHEGYCGSRLMYNIIDGSMHVSYPQAEEIIPGGALFPSFDKRLVTPWRIITIGNLNDVFTSTLGTDLANPAISIDTAYIKGGPSSWSWIIKKDESINFNETINYIDYASKMQWPYCLIDVNWDINIGYEKMRVLVDYAEKKNVGLLLWYNSSGSWNSTDYTPKSQLLTREMRYKEFAKLQAMGIKGMKIDFFGGDGVSMIQYYHDILKDAEHFKLLVNFHGATLPRGWHRTYPNLMTMESIKGQEFITFFQDVADNQAVHCATIPFTRNIFDPMDFTPMILDSIPNIKRKTSKCFELALPFLFLSGIQHLAESPDGMRKQNPEVVKLLNDVPVNWLESKLLSGYPGKFVIAARRIEGAWYIMGINATNDLLKQKIDLEFTNASYGQIFKDNVLINDIDVLKMDLSKNKVYEIDIPKQGGFVMKLF